MVKVDFTEAIEQSKRLLMPIVEAIAMNEEIQLQWDKNKKEWI